MFLKVIALTLKSYMKQMWNIWDGFVAILSIAEIILEMTSFSKQRGFTIIRSLRLVSEIFCSCVFLIMIFFLRMTFTNNIKYKIAIPFSSTLAKKNVNGSFK